MHMIDFLDDHCPPQWQDENRGPNYRRCMYQYAAVPRIVCQSTI